MGFAIERLIPSDIVLDHVLFRNTGRLGTTPITSARQTIRRRRYRASLAPGHTRPFLIGQLLGSQHARSDLGILFLASSSEG